MNWSNPGTALITGASSGLGAGFARQLAIQGFNIVLVARRKERLKELASELGRQYSVQTDIRIQSLCPGFTYTEFHDAEGMKGFDRTWFSKE